MSQGDISKGENDDIINMCIRCFQGTARNKYGIWDPLRRTSINTSGGVTQT